MNKKLLLIFLSFISNFLICHGQITCSSYSKGNSLFSEYANENCMNLIPTSTSKKCIYSGSSCISVYKDCEDYTASGDFNDATCTAISTTAGKKCVVETVSGNKVCKSADKTCPDDFISGSGKDACFSLKVKTNVADASKKRCALDLVNGSEECRPHYKDCGDATSDQTTCEKNIPESPLKKCVWVENPPEGQKKCQEENRGCTEYSNINLYYGTTKCSVLEASTGKKCILNGPNNCIEGKSCGDFKSGDTCDSGFYPIDSDSDNLVVSNLYKCDSTNGCIKTEKKCSDYTPGDTCENLKTDNPDKKRCKLLGTNCEEVYLDCSLGTSSTCNGITLYKASTNNGLTENKHSKCEWETTCQMKDKECSEFNGDQALCLEHSFTDTRSSTKKCIYSGSQCKEVVQTCENYVMTNNAGNDKTFCEEIYPKSDPKECVYIASKDSEPAKCITKERECSDSNGNDARCPTFKTTNTTHYCLYSSETDEDGNYICKEQYRECNTATSDRIECETNIPYDRTKECILEKDSECKLTTKQAEAQPAYHYCSDYREDNALMCSRITPLTKEGEAYTYSVKCQMKNNKCVLVQKCEPEADKLQCYATKLKDPNKICVYDENKALGERCIEQYKDCATAEANKKTEAGSDNENKETCEKLIGQKCVYNTSTKICTAADIQCENFNPYLLRENSCTLLTNSLTDQTQRCVLDYSSGTCKGVQKTCSELSTFPNSVGADEKQSVCENADVSGTGKKCIVNSDGTGCILDDGSTPQTQPDSNPQTNNGGEGERDDGNNDEGNSARGQYFNKLFILILCLLF